MRTYHAAYTDLSIFRTYRQTGLSEDLCECDRAEKDGFFLYCFAPLISMPLSCDSKRTSFAVTTLSGSQHNIRSRSSLALNVSEDSSSISGNVYVTPFCLKHFDI